MHTTNVSRALALLALGIAANLAPPAAAQIERPRPNLTPRGPVAATSTASPCVVDPGQITAQRTTQVSAVSAGRRAPPPPKPTKTSAARPPDASLAVQPVSLGADVSPQLCESLKTGHVTPDEVTAALETMRRDHAGKSHKKRKRFRRAGISYTYEYTLDIGNLTFMQKPGVGYCADYDWRYKVRNVSQRDFTVFSTTGEVGLCFSPGFGLFFIPGLSQAMPFPVPGLCFDDAAITKLDLRNVNDRFEEGLVELVNVAFEKLQKYDAKVCIIGAAIPPWFAPVIIPTGQMLVYCTSTRNCEVDAAKLLAAAKGTEK